jgi:hypothetical protein
MTTFFVTIMNCDLNVYNHIPYKPLQGCDYKKKKNLQNNLLKLKWKCQLINFSYVVYSSLYYELLNLKKVVIFAF